VTATRAAVRATERNQIAYLRSVGPSVCLTLRQTGDGKTDTAETQLLELVHTAYRRPRSVLYG